MFTASFRSDLLYYLALIIFNSLFLLQRFLYLLPVIISNIILMLNFVNRSTSGLLELLSTVKNRCILLFLLPLVPENSSERSFFIKAELTIKNFFVFTLLEPDIVSVLFLCDVVLGCELFSLKFIFEKVKNTLFMLL